MLGIMTFGAKIQRHFFPVPDPALHEFDTHKKMKFSVNFISVR